MTWFRILITAAMTLGMFTMFDEHADAQDDATIELHWRDCATVPVDGKSWYDHCHDGPWRSSISEGRQATFMNDDSGEQYTGELDGYGDMSVSVPTGTYTFLHPPGHDMVDSDFVCSLMDDQRNPVETIDDSFNFEVASGDHVVCDLYIVWDGGRAGPMPVESDDPQGIIEMRWRACSSAAADEDWYSLCFESDSELGLEPQEDRRISVRSTDGDPPRGGSLDASGNVQIVVPPGDYTLSTMTGDFVTADYLYCSIVDDAGDAVEMDIPTDPVLIEDDMHIVCDYFYVAE